MIDDNLGAGTKVKLTVDLTKYGVGLVPGIEGVTTGRHGIWSANFDKFITVNFPSVNQTLDVLWESLETIGENEQDRIIADLDCAEEEAPRESRPLDEKERWRLLGYVDYDDFRRQRELKEEERIKKTANIVKTVGPLGGFISLEYDSFDLRGHKYHRRITQKMMARDDEETFKKHGLIIKIDRMTSRPKPKSKVAESKIIRVIL